MFYLEKKYDLNIEQVLDSFIYHIRSKGYVVLADVDVKSILNKSLNYDFKKYHILEICNPNAAKEIIGNDDLNGLFLPCKIIVYEDGNTTKLQLLRISEIADSFFKKGKKAIDKFQSEMEDLVQSFAP